MKEDNYKLKTSPHYSFGHDYFGPFLYGFVRWLKRMAEAGGYKKAFFFSRDGFMMKKAFDLIQTSVSSEYVYFSRRSIRQTLFWKEKTYEESLKYLGWERFLSVGKLLEYYGFTSDERQVIAEDQSLDLDADIPFDALADNPLIKDIYYKYKSDIDYKSRTQSGLLLEYLKTSGLLERSAVIDIGWHGSMQRYLELFLENYSLEPAFEGYYVGVLPKTSLKTKASGYIYDERNPRKRKELLCFFGGYEKLFQGFEGSCAGYQKKDGVVSPVLDPYEYAGEKGILSAVSSLQAGAVDYVAEAVSGNPELDDAILTKPLIRFGMYPRLKDTGLFSSFYTFDGSKRYFTAQKSIFGYGLKEFLHALSNSQWKTGFLKSAFKLPLPYFWLYEVMRK